ncbi:ATP-binding protein, partial [Streptomyces sp. NPDC013178]|uniref:ATP-binding protein n=1 Tax=Streptomyces sp. NPDC013178 TaxID=3155118 RepID=UPI0033C0262B
MVEAVRGGRSGVVVLRGEAGVGKTALLDYVAGFGGDVRVLRVVGVQSEMELAYAGLHRLCGSLVGGVEGLPGVQREALLAALGLGSVGVPDRFLVGLAVLGLLSELARERPLVCLVDDVQWLDRASVQVLAFVARRLVAESVGVVFAVRSGEVGEGGVGGVGGVVGELEGLRELVVRGLPEGDARVLLRSVLPGVWDERVVERVVAETRGNPLALVELAREWAPVELAGGFGLPGVRGVSGRVQELFARRVVRLAPDVRRWLLIAAAEPGGDPALLWRAADRLGIGIGVASVAGVEELVRIDERVRFRHPLVRSAVYWAASPQERRRAHRVLAEVTDRGVDPDRRAWHAAQGVVGVSEEVAVELVRSASRARSRGGLAAAAAFLGRAVELTPDRLVRQERALAAAGAMFEAGTPDEALRLLSVVEAGEVEGYVRGKVDLLRAQIAFAVERGSDAAPLLLRAARQLEAYDPRLARDTYLDAVNAAMFA